MDLTQIEFPVLVLSVLSNIALAFVVIRNKGASVNGIIFSLLALNLAVWSIVNYFSLHSTPETMLFWVKMVMFFAAPQPLLFYLFIRNFSSDHLAVSKKHILTTVSILLVVMGLTISDLVFSGSKLVDGEFTPIPGPAISLFGLFTAGFIIAGVYYLVKRYLVSKDTEKTQLQFIFVGFVITLLMLFVFVFVMVVLFEVTELVRISPLFTLPLILFMSYAIARHHVMNVKAVAAEVLTIIIVFILLIQSFSSTSVNELIFNLLFALIISIIGVLLVKSVIREVQQREQLEVLSKKLTSANKQLKKLDQAKTEFLSITSHQLRTPLSAIKGYISMMLDEDFGKLKKEQSDVMGHVFSEVERLIRLVQVFLNVSRIESGRLNIDKIKFNLEDLVKNAVTELSPTAESKNLKLLYKGTKKFPVMADKDKLKDVVVNLIDNAIKYTPKGSVTATITKEKTQYLVEVHDTGVGIDPGEADMLFKKFSRMKGIAQVSADGSGLGLFIAKKIVEGHGGKIWAKSDGKDKGSTFAFRIPIK